MCSSQYAECSSSKEVSSSEDEPDDDTKDFDPHESNNDDSGIQPDDEPTNFEVSKKPFSKDVKETNLPKFCAVWYERPNLKPKPATPLDLFLDQCLNRYVLRSRAIHAD